MSNMKALSRVHVENDHLHIYDIPIETLGFTHQNLCTGKVSL